MGSLVLCYALRDEEVARRLGRFLEINLPFQVSFSEGVVRPDFDLVEATERALSADVALVLLSPDSVPKYWNRQTWEPVFLKSAGELGALLGFVLIRACQFPELLRRRYFFDASVDPLAAARELKRWLLRPQPLIHRETGLSPEVSALRSRIADEPGVAADIDPELAARFAGECAGDFEAVHYLDCRSRAGVVGDLGYMLGLRLSAALERNIAEFHAFCRNRRFLFMLAGLAAVDTDLVRFEGKTSVILTASAGVTPDVTHIFLAGARDDAQCQPMVGDAVRQFYELLGSELAVALRLGWVIVAVLKTAGRFAETVELLDAMAHSARESDNTAALARIEREQFWMQDYAEGAIGAPPHFATDSVQLVFGFASPGGEPGGRAS